MKVVDLADEFGLTTTEAIDACLWAGVPANSSATELTLDDAERVRELLSGWIDAGFAPWRSGEQQPSAKKGARKAQAAAAAAAAETGPPLPTRGDGSTATLEPPGERTSSATAGLPPPPTGKASRPSSRRAAVVGGPEHELPETVDRSEPQSADPDGDGAAPVGPLPPASQIISPSSAPPSGPMSAGALLASGRPTGWLPGGPDAQPRMAPLAVLALALAIASLVVPFITAVLAIVLASVAKDRIEHARGWMKGERVATAAQIVAGVGIGLWLVLLAGQVLVIQTRDHQTDFSDVQVDQATVAYNEIKTGECVRMPKVGDITDWRVVTCGDAHQAEVFASLPISNAIGLGYPGDAPIQSTAKADCRKRLGPYIDDPSVERDLEVGYAYPSRQTWGEGDRAIWCVAFRKDGTLLGSSIAKPTTTTVTTAAPPGE